MLAWGRLIILRMRPWFAFGSSSLQGPSESAVDAKVGAVLASIVIIWSGPAPYTASVAEVTGSWDTCLFFRSGGAVRHGIGVSSIVIELHHSRVRVVSSSTSIMRLHLQSTCSLIAMTNWSNPGVAYIRQYGFSLEASLILHFSRAKCGQGR